MEDRNKDLEGKVAIVTGAGDAGGVGYMIVRVLAEAGAKVVFSDIRDAALGALAEPLKKEGLNVASRAVDISNEKSVEALIQFTVKTFGRIDTVVNNAARLVVPQDLDVVRMPVDVWDKIMETNERGGMLMCKHSLPVMIEGGGGSIINISSGASFAGDMQATAYACSKAAINTLTRYVATQYGDKGIRCNALAPGVVRSTRGITAFTPDILELFTAHHVVGRLGETKDIAEAVRFLASDHSSWITGQVISIDGGFFTHLPTTVGVAELMAKARQ